MKISLFMLVLSGLGVVIPLHRGTAAQERLSWSTYLHTGPGDRFSVMEELYHDTAVDVLGCNDAWCRVSSDGIIGYVDKDALTLPQPPSGKLPIGGPQGCFIAGQYSWRVPEPTRFCQTQPHK